MLFDFINKELVFACAAWFVAQFMKIIVNLITGRDLNLKNAVFASGGMPSSHSATVSALCTAMAVDYGLKSPYFAITFILAFIVMYDAMNVRRETGEQGKFLNELMKEIQNIQRLGHMADSQRMFKELVGHTPAQVFAGCGVGILVGLFAVAF